uniref:CD40 n=1 Tax=Paralichthys olivaceus TaxID=8255 RepID=Q76LB4_PAROL|nr:CD40 [Paralichthys olivaceus]
MLLFMVVVMLCTEVTVKTWAQSLCDPLTQYEEAGQCSKMCGPGTRRMSQSTCTDPQCAECGNREYQDRYTREAQCKRQPYCDPNKNLRVTKPESKTKQSPCICLLGFHCSSGTCVTCVPHATCKPGQWAKIKGNLTHDTVCESCPEGSFSTSHSWSSVCTKWTECESGYHIQESGTNESDNICVEPPRHHGGLIACVVAVGSLAVVGLMVCLCKGETKQRAKDYLESCHGDKENLQREPSLVLFTTLDETENHELLPFTEEEEMKIPEKTTRTKGRSSWWMLFSVTMDSV